MTKNNYLDKAAILEFLERSGKYPTDHFDGDSFDDFLEELIKDINDGAYDA